MIRYAKWLPDRYALNAPDVAGEASGVLPGPASYLPWPGLATFSLALASACRGAFLARKTDGGFTLFAGTQTGLYKYIGAGSAWTDVSRTVGGAYNVPNDQQWSFTQFGDYLIACNANDAPQYIAITAGTNFAVLTNAPTATYTQTVGDHLWFGNISSYPNRVMWSAYNDITGWTVGLNDCDYQDFPDGGFVVGLTSLEIGLVFQRGCIRRFAKTNDRSVYAFALAEAGRGLLAPASLATIGQQSFFLSEDGFYVTNGVDSAPIGVDQVDKWFQAEVNYDRVYSVIGAADPVRARVFFLFPSTSNDSVLLDRLLCYDLATQSWTHTSDITASYIVSAATGGYTLDGLDALGYDLDSLPFSLDARFLDGGAPFLAAFNSAFKLCFFAGSNLAARVETADVQLVPTRRAFVQGVIPEGDSTAITINVGRKERAQDSLSYGGAVAINSQGFSPQRASARFHRFRADIAAGESWNHIVGVEPIYVDDGER